MFKVDLAKTHGLRIVAPPIETANVEFELTDPQQKIYSTCEGHLIQGLTIDQYNPNVFRGVVRNNLFETMEKPFFIEVKGYGKEDKDKHTRLIVSIQGRKDIKKLNGKNIPSIEMISFNPKSGILEIYTYGNNSGRTILITIFPSGDYSVIVPDEFKPKFTLVTYEPTTPEPKTIKSLQLVQRELF